METDVDSVRAVTTETIEMETEMAADLAREDHRAVRDVSEEKTEITVVKDALADRTTRVDSAGSGRIFLYNHIGKDERKRSNRVV